MEKAKLFKNGQSQAVRLPKKFRFEGDEVFITRFENGVLLLPKDNPWQPLLKSLEEFSADFMEKRVQPEYQTRKGLE